MTGAATERTIGAFPSRIVIEPTAKCNLSCFMCPRHHISAADTMMDVGLWRRLVDEVADRAPDAVVLPFWRGESLLHPNYCEMMEYALEKHLRLHMCSNGHLMGDRHFEVMSRMEFVTFSLHARKGYEKALAFAAHCRGRPVKLQVSFVDCEETAKTLLGELTALPDLGGFGSVRLYREHTKGGVFGGGTAGAERAFCPKLGDTIAIAADGSVSRCNHQWRTNPELNVTDMTIAQAWTSAAYAAVRDGYPDAKCSGCDQWSGHTQGERWIIEDGHVKHEVFR